MTDAAEFIDAALRSEVSWNQTADHAAAEASRLRVYGASVGAVRGTIRNAERKYPGLDHDEITALSSELWDVPVFERRLATIVLLQSNVRILRVSDLTRVEGFVRAARLPSLADPLADDVLRPLIEGMDGRDRAKAMVVLERWAGDPDEWLRRAASRLGDRDGGL